VKAARIIAFCGVLLAAGCERTEPIISGPLPQRGYLWQRNWTPAVNAACREAQQRMQGVVLLGAEVEWTNDQPHVVRATIDWEIVKATGTPCSIALRVAPLRDMAGAGGRALPAIARAARSLLADARGHGVAVREFQLDYDCAQRNLAAYRSWLHQLRAVVSPARFVITTLPSWLDEPSFEALVREVDGYVLQVHSVPLTDVGGAKLCDTGAARRWVTKAARFKLPFSVALPTYRCTAGYGPAGKLIGVALDGLQPSWPPGTRTLVFRSDATEIAALVNEWERARPSELRELLWYRIPVATDLRNWRWPTLRAVMSGRKPARHFMVVPEGENPVDLSIVNAGESDEELEGGVIAEAGGGQLVAADALAGWQIRRQGARTLFAIAPGDRVRLPPGASRRIGWLRYAEPAKLEVWYESQAAR
jgi:Protein of unknown function (DUF3142)